MKKRGFTLIELLAIIVIISILVIITVPMISGVIESAKINSAQNSFKSYMRQMENKVLENDIGYEEENFPQLDSRGCYNLTELDKIVDIKGKHPIIIKKADQPTVISNDEEEELKTNLVCFENGDLTYVSPVKINDITIYYENSKIITYNNKDKQ